MSATYYVVQSFQMGRKGVLIPDEPREAQSERQARAMALRLSETKAGALAFSRTGDMSTGDWEDAVILAQHGLVPADLMELAS